MIEWNQLPGKAWLFLAARNSGGSLGGQESNSSCSDVPPLRGSQRILTEVVLFIRGTILRNLKGTQLLTRSVSSSVKGGRADTEGSYFTLLFSVMGSHGFQLTSTSLHSWRWPWTPTSCLLLPTVSSISFLHNFLYPSKTSFILSIKHSLLSYCG